MEASLWHLGVVAAFDWSLFLERVFQPDSDFWRALWTTVYIAVISQVVGTFVGLLSALAGASRLLVLRLLSQAYVLVARGTPLIVQIFFTYYGANLLLGFNLFPDSVPLGIGTISGAAFAGIVALSFNEGAYMSEIIRAGILSVDRGQMEAAKSVGMPHWLGMRRIVLPQAARLIVPPLGNEFNIMIKSTSLLAFIGVYEVFQDSQVHYSQDFKPVEYFGSVAIWYLVLTMLWSLVQTQLERKLGAADVDADEGWASRILGMRGEREMAR
jgi:polar amino acid transport system permease protein